MHNYNKNISLLSFFSSVAAFSSIKEKEPSPEPHIAVIVHPPPKVLVYREAPAYLPCVANITGRSCHAYILHNNLYVYLWNREEH